VVLDHLVSAAFPPINRGYDKTFRANSLSLGLVAPLEAHGGDPVPTLTRHLERAQLAEELGFAALWLRDVPFNVPSFGDAGQTHDPFVYLGYLAARTKRIALGVASVVLPLRHPAHVAKSAASADALSQGRLILGVASGDRPEEYPALGLSYHDRGARLRDSVDYIERVWEQAPVFQNAYGSPGGGMDMLPKPTCGRVPLLITGSSQQSPEWIARHGDGWITYPRTVEAQARIITAWRASVREAGGPEKPALQSLYIDLVDDPDRSPEPIHLGFRSGTRFLTEYLTSLKEIGINHIALNLRFNQGDVERTMRTLADKVLPALQA